MRGKAVELADKAIGLNRKKGFLCVARRGPPGIKHKKRKPSGFRQGGCAESGNTLQNYLNEDWPNKLAGNLTAAESDPRNRPLPAPTSHGYMLAPAWQSPAMIKRCCIGYYAERSSSAAGKTGLTREVKLARLDTPNHPEKIPETGTRSGSRRAGFRDIGKWQPV